jgi:hypothetical protein
MSFTIRYDGPRPYARKVWQYGDDREKAVRQAKLLALHGSVANWHVDVDLDGGEESFTILQFLAVFDA